MTELILNARFLTRSPTGVDRVATELINALDAMGLPDGFDGIHGLKPAGIVTQTLPLRVPTKASTSRLKGHLWEQFALAHQKPDDWLLSLCNIGPVLRHRQIVMMHDAQVFSAPHSYTPAFRTWYQHVQPLLGRRAGMVLTVSEHAKAELERYGVVPKGKARVVPNGADHILRKPTDTRILEQQGLKPQQYFLTIGSLAPHKNIDLVTHAARNRRDTSMPLVIAGGADPNVFVGAGIYPSQDVRLTGRVSDAELRALYENATALVFPSLTEGFGLPPVEAMMCGCPVIATTGGAVPEVCGDAVMYVDPLDASGWTNAVTRLQSEPELRAHLSYAGHRRAAAFTWANAAAILSQHLSELPQRGVSRQGREPRRHRIGDPVR